MKKLYAHFSRIFCLLAVLAALTLTAFAVETGTCGANLTYTLDTETGVLTVSGTGAMPDYYAATPAPWSDYASYVRTVNIGEGVTRVGNMAFDGCTKLKSLSLPSTLTAMGASLPFESPLYQSMADGEVCIDGWLIGYKGTRPTRLSVSEGIIGIADNVFAFDAVETAVLPKSLQYIGRYVFFFCQSLTDVTVLNPQCNIESSMAYLPFPQSTVLHGYRGSTAEAYASMFGNSFVAIDGGVPGDVNGDGKVTKADLLRLQKYLAKWKVDINEAAADCNGDGKISKADLLRLQKYLAKWPVKLGE